MEGMEGTSNKKSVLGAQHMWCFVRYVFTNLKPYYLELLVLKIMMYQIFEDNTHIEISIKDNHKLILTIYTKNSKSFNQK